MPRDSSDSRDPISLINNEYTANGVVELRTGVDLEGYLLVPDIRRERAKDNASIRRRAQQELQEWTTVESGPYSLTE